MTRARADELGAIAEQTLRDLLSTWYDLGDRLTKDHPDLLGVDLRTVIPSSWGPSHSIAINWQVKARSSRIPPDDAEQREKTIRVGLAEGEARSLALGQAGGDSLILALGIPRIDDVHELRLAPAADRFSWFAIDINQYCKRREAESAAELKAVHVPSQNSLCLATASLLWGSIWYQKQMRRMGSSILEADPRLAETAAAFMRDGQLESEVLESLDREASYYVNALRGVDKSERQHLNFLFGTALTQANIIKLIWDSGGADSYRVYAVEGLGEGLNLWLFSRQVRGFLRWTIRACNGEYRRLFPVGALHSLPRHIKCALWHAALVHRERGVELDFVEPLKEAERTDHLHVDRLGGITTNVFDQDDSFRLSHFAGSGQEDELLRTLEARSHTGHYIPDDELRQLLGLSAEETVLAVLPPRDLLAPEGSYLEHPFELWRGWRNRRPVR